MLRAKQNIMDSAEYKRAQLVPVCDVERTEEVCFRVRSQTDRKIWYSVQLAQTEYCSCQANSCIGNATVV